MGVEMTFKKLLSAAVLSVLPLSTPSTQADTIAYSTDTLVGNQSFGGNLGLDFNVLSPIFITALGAYDSNHDGISPAITVGIFSRNPGTGDPNADTTGTPVGLPVFVSGNADPLINGYRFVTLATPLYLAPGAYTIDAVGFGDGNLNGNENIANFSITTDTGGNLVKYVGTGRYDENASFDYPTTTSALHGYPDLSPHPFAGGSFAFVAAPLPWSASSGLILLGAAGFSKFRGRKRA